MTYDEALDHGRKIGARWASDPVLMAMLCDSTVQLLCGAVSPRLVWEGAQKKGVTTTQLADMMVESPLQVSDLQWVE